MDKYTVRLESGEIAVELTEEVDAGFVDKHTLGERAAARLAELSGAYPSGNEEARNAMVTIECTCNSASTQPVNHKRECPFRVAVAIKEGTTSQI